MIINDYLAHICDASWPPISWQNAVPGTDFGTTDGREGEKRMLQAHGRMLAWNHNIIPMSASQPSTGLSLSEIPRPTAEALQTFAAFKGGEAAEAFRSLATFTGEETERENQGGGQAFTDLEVGLQSGSRSSVAGCSATTSRSVTGTTARFAGTVGSKPPNRHRRPKLFGSFSRPLYRSPGGPSLAPADESLGLFDNHLTNPAARSALMLLCH